MAASSTTAASRWPLWAGLATAFGVLVLIVEVAPRAAEAVDLYAAWRAEAERFGEVDPAAQARLEAERERLAATAADALVELPASGELSAILDAVHAAADTAGVVVTGVEPGAARATAGFETVPMGVAVRGGGHGVGRFVSELERGALLVKVRALTVTGSGLGPGPATARVDLDALRLGNGRG